MKVWALIAAFVFALTVYGHAQEVAPAPAKVGAVYGKELQKTGAKSVYEAQNILEQSDKFSGKLEGTVTRVCTSKGCWLALKSDDSDTPVIVRFRDYGFFVPEDIVGKKVVVEGHAKTNAKEDKDGKRTKDISFTADGVLVVK